MTNAIATFARTYALQIIGLAVVIAALAVEVAAAIAFWPTSWDAAAEGALAGVLIAQGVAIASIPLKIAFDEVSLKTQNRLAERAKVLETYHAYSSDYLMPLAGIAQELARHLIEYQRARSEGAKRRAIDAAFYACAHYVRMQWALIGIIPFPGAARPMGVFLRSASGEELVWDLMMPPGVLGIRSLVDQSQIIQNLWKNPSGSSADDQAHVPPSVFLERAHKAGEPLSDVLRQFANTVSRHQYLDQVIQVLTALNDAVNYEVRSTFDSWYGAGRGRRPVLIQTVEQYPDEVKTALGIFYRPAVPAAR